MNFIEIGSFMSERKPRVLVISHNAFSGNSNMGKTISSWFDSWGTERVAQLYLHSEIPNSPVCVNYFRITDVDVVKSLFTLRAAGAIIGNSVPDERILSNRIDKGFVASVYEYGRKKNSWKTLARDALWSFGTWRTSALQRWLDEFRPEIVFFAPGSFRFSIDIALHISRSRQIPLVLYVADDYYFIEFRKRGPLGAIVQKRFRKRFAELMAHVSHCLVVSDKMAEVYRAEFGVACDTLMISTIIQATTPSSENHFIAYIGNLSLNRWKKLVEIGQELKRRGQVLNIFSGDTSRDILRHLTAQNGIVFNGRISPEEVKKTIAKSTILVHVESDDHDSQERTRYSVSTKIAESLGSGVCLLAYGPSEVASMEYLQKQQAACVVRNRNELGEKLQTLLDRPDIRKRFGEDGLRTAREFHNAGTNRELLKTVLSETVVGHAVARLR